MKRTLSMATWLRHGLLTAVFASLVLIPTGAQSQSSPAAAIDLSPSGSVTAGTAINVTMRFSDLTFGSDTNLTFPRRRGRGRTGARTTPTAMASASTAT